MIIARDKITHKADAGCSNCTGEHSLDFDFTMALQPIVDVERRSIFAQEALVRGLNNEPAGFIFEHVNDDNRYAFDQACRVKAVELAANLDFDAHLSINFMPRAVYSPELCIRTTMAAAERFGLPKEQIIFEITEGEKVDDLAHLQDILRYYRSQGFKTAIDDFGAGWSGLNLLADVETDFIKLDRLLIKDINEHKNRQAIVKGIMQVCRELDITVIGEGIETREELATLRDFGIELFQGYYFARPSFRSLAEIQHL